MRNSLLSVAGTLVVILCCLLAILSLASAESTKEWKWQKQGVVLPPGTVGMIDEGTARAPCVIPEGSGTYRMYYTGGNRGAHRPGIGDVKVKMSICLATAKLDEPKQWQRHPKNPVFTVSESGFDSEGVDFPFVVPVSGNLWYMYYVGWGKTRTTAEFPIGPDWPLARMAVLPGNARALIPSSLWDLRTAMTLTLPVPWQSSRRRKNGGCGIRPGAIILPQAESKNLRFRSLWQLPATVSNGKSMRVIRSLRPGEPGRTPLSILFPSRTSCWRRVSIACGTVIGEYLPDRVCRIKRRHSLGTLARPSRN